MLRALVKMPGWLEQNPDVYRMWMADVDPWHCFIRDLSAYTKQVRAHTKATTRAK
jgi:hypothetical protein